MDDIPKPKPNPPPAKPPDFGPGCALPKKPPGRPRVAWVQLIERRVRFTRERAAFVDSLGGINKAIELLETKLRLDAADKELHNPRVQYNKTKRAEATKPHNISNAQVEKFFQEFERSGVLDSAAWVAALRPESILIWIAQGEQSAELGNWYREFAVRYMRIKGAFEQRLQATRVEAVIENRDAKEIASLQKDLFGERYGGGPNANINKSRLTIQQINNNTTIDNRAIVAAEVLDACKLITASDRDDLRKALAAAPPPPPSGVPFAPEQMPDKSTQKYEDLKGDPTEELVWCNTCDNYTMRTDDMACACVECGEF